MSAKLEIKNVNFIYSVGTPFEHKALDDVSLSIGEGELVGLIGHTGSGKSTLIQHFNGLLRPSSGQILLNGADIWAEPKKIRQVRFRVGLVFQYPEYQLFEETVFKDIAFGPSNAGLDEAQIRSRVLEAMDFVGLAQSLLEKSPFELSGGQKRRVAIAGVIAMQPEVLILDEPTAGLDPRGCRDILDHIRQYHESKNCTVILVSHSMEDVARIAGRIVVMNQAKIALDGTPGAIFTRASEIENMGLSLPSVTRVFIELSRLGLPVNTSIYTLEQAEAQLLALKGGQPLC